MSKGDLLDARDIAQCPHRVALERRGPQEATSSELSVETQRRQRESQEHRDRVLASLLALHPDAVVATGVASTHDAVEASVSLIVSPTIPHDHAGGRRASAHALVRTGRYHGRTGYAPLLIRHSEVTTPMTTRRLLEGSLAKPSPAEATWVGGLGTRRNDTVLRNGLMLAHTSRTLESLGWHDPALRAGLVDRSSRLWWFELSTLEGVRWTLADYDARYEQRRQLLSEVATWDGDPATYPTAPYWHRECVDCPYATGCQERLAAVDDVSLTHFTSFSQQVAIRDAGVTTRAALAALNPEVARRSRGQLLPTSGEIDPARVLGRTVDKLDELIYRARVHVNGAPLRVVAPERLSCPTAEVEVDVDMESCDDVTYLWGATVRGHAEGVDVPTGYHAFVTWDELTPGREAAVFAEFWSFFDELRRRVEAAGATFAAYCFWAQAEDGAMTRATTDAPALRESLERFREGRRTSWVDLHEVAKGAIQTEGAFGLKTLASLAGFSWRDENPSGEASMSWYEVATGDDPAAAADQRSRLLAYNEDDCLATAALRDWLNGPARTLRHRDDPLGPWVPRH